MRSPLAFFWIATRVLRSGKAIRSFGVFCHQALLRLLGVRGVHLRRRAAPGGQNPLEILGCLYLAAALAGCSQSPFPADELSVIKQPLVATQNYRLVYESAMEFTEGELAEYTIVAQVPAGGSPVVTAEGLPEGAKLLESPLRLSWQPPAGSSRDPVHPARDHVTYRARLTLRSAVDPKVVIRRPLVLIDNAR
jgi:hypothetical protein